LLQAWAILAICRQVPEREDGANHALLNAAVVFERTAWAPVGGQSWFRGTGTLRAPDAPFEETWPSCGGPMRLSCILPAGRGNYSAPGYNQAPLMSAQTRSVRRCRRYPARRKAVVLFLLLSPTWRELCRRILFDGSDLDIVCRIASDRGKRPSCWWTVER